jgi:hypothetical protein
MGSGTIRIGGLFGVASAPTVIPAYLAGSPEVPKNPSDAHSYFDSAASFLTANGTLPLLHLLLGLLFVGVMVSVLRSAAGPTGAVYTALIGGAVFLSLMAAGLAAEVCRDHSIRRRDGDRLLPAVPRFGGVALPLQPNWFGRIGFRDRLCRLADGGTSEMVR